MNTPSSNDAHKDSSSNRTPPAKPGAINPASKTAGTEQKANPRTTAQATANQTPPRTTTKENPAPPLRAAKGDDALMSKQQQQAMPSGDAIKGKWQQQIGAAKIAWGKLTDDELLKSEGHEQKLAGLIQERYATTRDDAEKRVKSFFAKH